MSLISPASKAFHWSEFRDGRVVSFRSGTLSIRELRVYNAPKNKIEFAKAVAACFIFHHQEYWPVLNGFPGYDGVNIVIMQGEDVE